ncbi:MAG TPA: hypothetical protein VHR45_13720 [Thermoanaerobaculia bacterium]|nr:hypothetical protein [Thermoanaerobaculia bacterium]
MKIEETLHPLAGKLVGWMRELPSGVPPQAAPPRRAPARRFRG